MVQNKSGLMIISLFVGVILAIIFIQILGDVTQDTSTIRTANDTLIVAGNAALLGTKTLRDANNIITTGTIMTNGTNVTIGENNYIVSTNGSVQLKAGMTQASAQGNNPTNLRLFYSYFSENFVKDATSRNLISLIVLFFVIGLIIYLIYYLKNNTGLFDSF